MGTICFLSKSQNVFSLPLAQKLFLQKKKKMNIVATVGGVFFFFGKGKPFWLKKLFL